MAPRSPRFNVSAIRALMLDRGWLPADLARRTPYSAKTISLFLRRRVQTARVARAIADALDVQVAEIQTRRAP